MAINNNDEALAAMENMLRSITNRVRSIYNYGYKDGFRDGVETATREVTEKIILDKYEELEEGPDHE